MPIATELPEPWFVLLGYAFTGCIALYMVNRASGVQPFSLCKAVNIGVGRRAKPLTIIVDMVISSAIGCVLVVGLTTPQTIPQAVAAGLGLSGILAVGAKPGADT